MYEYKNNTYAEAGNILQGSKALGMSLPNTFAPFTERPIDLTNLTIDGKYLCFDIFKWKHNGIVTFEDARKFIVSKRYSLDEQIEIIMNKDDGEDAAMEFRMLKEWRSWAAVVAHKVMEVINNTNQAEDNEQD